MVVAGLRADVNRMASIGGVENAGFNIFTELFLPPLDALECREMVTNIGQQIGMTYEDEALDIIYQESGGHPMLARQLCSLLWNHLRQAHPGQREITVTAQATRQMVVAFIDDNYRSSNLAAIWESRLNEAELAVVLRLAGSSEPLERLAGERLAMNGLVERHIVVQTGSLYTLKFGLFKRWIRAYVLNMD
jgi:hypothetical protein